MKIIHAIVCAVLLTGGALVQAAETQPAPAILKLKPVPFTQVEIRDKFWLPRIVINRTKTLPHCLDWCEKTGRISNFAKAAGIEKGEFVGKYFNDSDLYKVIEGAAYCLATHPDKELEARVDKIIDLIAAAQQPDGYINTYFTLVEPKNRWTNLFMMHELYCAGHMIEAAVAYAQATGKTKFLDVAKRMADHIDSVFGPGKKFGYSGHQEIELALFKLYAHTGEERYRKLSEWFIGVRGTRPLEHQHADPSSIQAHIPILQQKDIVGHAVRAMYMYAGVADLVALTGNPDYLRVMDTIWNSVALHKMYITGGVGSQRQHEAFGDNYFLPNDSAYAETCAAIALAFWNQRMLMLHGDGRYADIVEKVLYNGALSGVSLDGEKFFYENPLMSAGRHHRQPWYDTACCPSNLVRVIPSIGAYLYAVEDKAVWINQFVTSTVKLKVNGVDAVLKLDTDFPWSGQVKVAITIPKRTVFRINMRVPQWATGTEVAVNEEPVHHQESNNGYVSLYREWSPGDVVTYTMGMKVQRVEAHPQVLADRGRIALQRGPIVYCLEAADNSGKVFNLALPRDAVLSEEFKPDLLGGVVVVRGKGVVASPADWSNRLYQSVAPPRPVDLTAIPYYAWDNREPGEMVVWIPEAVGLTEK